MDTLIWLLIAHLKRYREHLDDATITVIDQLSETDEQPNRSQKDAIYEAEWKLRRKLPRQEYSGRT